MRRALLDRPLLLGLPHKVLGSLLCLVGLFVFALHLWWFLAVAAVLYGLAVAAYARDPYCIEIWLQNRGKSRFEP